MTPGGRSPPRHGLDGQRRHPTHTADQWGGVWGLAPMSTPNATRAPCFATAFPEAVAPLQGSTRGAVAPPHTPPPARLVKPVFSGRRLHRAPTGATTMPQASPGGPRAARRRGDVQGRRPRRPTEGWAEVGGHAYPLGGLIIISPSSRSEDVRRRKTPFPYENGLFNGSEVDP